MEITILFFQVRKILLLSFLFLLYLPTKTKGYIVLGESTPENFSKCLTWGMISVFIFINAN